MASLGRCWDWPVPPSPLCGSVSATKQLPPMSQLISTPSLRAWIRALHGLEHLQVWGPREFQAEAPQVLSICLFCGL